MKFGTRVWSWDSVLHAKFCKNHLRGYSPLGQIYTKNHQFLRFWYMYAHIIATTVKYGVGVRTCDTLLRA